MPNLQLDEEAIFHVARLITEPDVRSKYLDQICTGDQPLRERVEALLQVHEQEREFLKSAPQLAVTTDRPALTESPGKTIGRYKLLQQIGEGGFGVVYMAEQERPIRRKVALKIIKPGMDTREVIARFESERQALALMDHPNIARVLDGGATDSGRPYFVMELVKGVPLTEYCDQNQLATEERLQLFIKVCQAVQHAHQKGIIHRDLKPSNILVTLHDGQPVVKVIDFGVAKAINQQLTEKTLFTSYGQMVGTPAYMSPEQAEMSGLDVDTRSDVYSLGVLLYELLTGTTPLESDRLRTAGYAEIQRLIREEEPPKPSTRLSTSGEKLTSIAKHRGIAPDRLQRLIRGDLDWIVMKALEKDRSRRYEMPNSLADDVSRYLNHETILARPVATSYRVRKFVQRNKLLVGAVSAIAVSLLLGTVVSTGLAIHASRKQRELQSVLSLLRTELLDRALSDAFAGDIPATEDSLKRATDAQASPDLIEVIRALSLLYGGQLSDALAILDAAEKKRPDDRAVLAAACWAHVYAGHSQEVSVLWERLHRIELPKSSVRNDYERLLVAQTKVFGSIDLPKLVAELDEIIIRHPRWGIAYAIRSEAKRELAKDTRKIVYLDDARSDSFFAERYHPDNPFVLATSLLAHTTSIELARHQNLSVDEIQELEARAASIAKQLERWPTYLQASLPRLEFYRLSDHPEALKMECDRLLEKGFGGDQSRFARILTEEDADYMRAALAQSPESLAGQTANAILDVINGDTEAALNTLEKMRRENTNLNDRWLMLDIALVAQQPNRARALALECLQQLPSRDCPAQVRNALWMTQYYAGEIDEEKLLVKVGPCQIEQSVAHYAIGMRKLSTARSAAEIAEVQRHLKLAAECVIPGWWHTTFAKAYLKLIEDGRLPPGRITKTESSAASPRNYGDQPQGYRQP